VRPRPSDALLSVAKAALHSAEAGDARLNALKFLRELLANTRGNQIVNYTMVVGLVALGSVGAVRQFNGATEAAIQTHADGASQSLRGADPGTTLGSEIARSMVEDGVEGLAPGDYLTPPVLPGRFRGRNRNSGIPSRGFPVRGGNGGDGNDDGSRGPGTGGSDEGAGGSANPTGGNAGNGNAGNGGAATGGAAGAAGNGGSGGTNRGLSPDGGAAAPNRDAGASSRDASAPSRDAGVTPADASATTNRGIQDGGTDDDDADDEQCTDESNCFVAGTLVLTATGQRPIEDIRVGDWVASRREGSDEVELQPVTDTYVREADALVEVRMTRATGESDAIRSTLEHPFWLQSRGWVQAADLAPGDILDDAWGGHELVESVSRLPQISAVYNFEVANNHTYFVGRSAVWVHNICTLREAREWEDERRRWSRQQRLSQGGLIKRGAQQRDAVYAQHLHDVESQFRSTQLSSKRTEACGEYSAAKYIHEKYPEFKMVMGFATGQGIDQIWKALRPDATGTGFHAVYLVVEAKGKKAGLGTTDTKGDQMSRSWISDSAAGLHGAKCPVQPDCDNIQKATDWSAQDRSGTEVFGITVEAPKSVADGEVKKRPGGLGTIDQECGDGKPKEPKATQLKNKKPATQPDYTWGESTYLNGDDPALVVATSDPFCRGQYGQAGCPSPANGNGKRPAQDGGGAGPSKKPCKRRSQGGALTASFRSRFLYSLSWSSVKPLPTRPAYMSRGSVKAPPASAEARV